MQNQGWHAGILAAPGRVAGPPSSGTSSCTTLQCWPERVPAAKAAKKDVKHCGLLVTTYRLAGCACQAAGRIRRAWWAGWYNTASDGSHCLELPGDTLLPVGPAGLPMQHCCIHTCRFIVQAELHTHLQMHSTSRTLACMTLRSDRLLLPSDAQGDCRARGSSRKSKIHSVNHT